MVIYFYNVMLCTKHVIFFFFLDLAFALNLFEERSKINNNNNENYKNKPTTTTVNEDQEEGKRRKRNGSFISIKY